MLTAPSPDVATAPARGGSTRPRHDPQRTDRALMGLLLFNAASSIGGGIALITGLIPEQPAWLEHTDFASLYLPGVILMAVVGGSSAIAAVGMAKQSQAWQLSAIVAGFIMMLWIVGEIASLRVFHFLQAIYFVTGALVVWCTPRSAPRPTLNSGHGATSRGPS